MSSLDFQTAAWIGPPASDDTGQYTLSQVLIWATQKAIERVGMMVLSFILLLRLSCLVDVQGTAAPGEAGIRRL